MFTPLALMMDRVRRYGSDSDTAMLTELLYAGEFIVKLTVAGLISGIENDRENSRYTLIHALVRADGVGEWARALDEALSGPATQFLSSSLYEVRKTFTERVDKTAWQYNVVSLLTEALNLIDNGARPIGDKLQLRAWFQLFAELRNKTRGHGALTPAACASIAPKVSESIDIMTQKNPIFELPWAYLHRNMSGKYRVAALGGDQSVFAPLKSAAAIAGENHPNGVYIHAERLRQVALIHTDLDASDFFVPNGAFGPGGYELHSLITDSRQKGIAAPFLMPPNARPPSETEGRGDLGLGTKFLMPFKILISL